MKDKTVKTKPIYDIRKILIRSPDLSKYSRINSIPFDYRFLFFKQKVKTFMSNHTRTFILALATTGFAAQIFVLITNKALDPAYSNVFNAIGSLLLFSSFIVSVLSAERKDKTDKIREEIYRDMDSIYRYVDDTARDIRDEIRDVGNTSSCGSSCGVRSRK